MRTAKVGIDVSILFEVLGIKFFDGRVESIEIDRNKYSQEDIIYLKVSGWDDRLPDKEDYPECLIETESIQSRFVEMKPI